MRILGVSGFYHDSAAALVVDGKIVAAAQEERFTRRKHDASFPHHAIGYCLEEAGLTARDLDHVAFYDKPFLKFERLLETYLAFAPRGFSSFRKAMPLWLREKLFQKNFLVKSFGEWAPDIDWNARLLFSEHHFSHACSAFFPSPFEKALVLTLDGVGEWATSSAAIGDGNRLEINRELHFPHSLGLLYAAVTYYLGFKVNSGEYKVMGLAPYGEPRYAQRMLDHLIDLKPDGTFRLDMSYFNYCVGLTMTNAKFDALFGGPPRNPDSELLEQRHMDLAASIQSVTETVVLTLTRALQKETGMRNLCLAGGVALNCVANGKVARDGKFDDLWIQPAAGDAGGAIGAALAAHHVHLGLPRIVPHRDGMNGGYLGPAFADDDIARRLDRLGARYTVLPRSAMIATVADSLAQGQVVGWFQGRMEFGPRALGARSILGDPRSPDMQKILNLKIKYRESFRPFAPAVLREDVTEWFDLDQDSPYMLLVAGVSARHRRAMTDAEQALFGIDKLNIPRSSIPAVTHVDYSARVQTVHADTNPLFHDLLEAFKARTGCPVLINTSFNVRGEPIVGSPEDAFRCLMGTEIEVLAVGNCLLRAADQNPALRNQYGKDIAPD
jgi:carbamoyltransferase